MTDSHGPILLLHSHHINNTTLVNITNKTSNYLDNNYINNQLNNNNYVNFKFKEIRNKKISNR